MTLEQKYLVLAYRKSQPKVNEGFDPDLPVKLLNLEQDQAHELVSNLTATGMIRQQTQPETKLVLDNRGLEMVRNLLRQKNIVLIWVRTAQSIPLSDKAEYGYTYRYQLVRQGVIDTVFSMITVKVSDIAAATLELDFRDGSARKVLLQYARLQLAALLMRGIRKEEEEMSITQKNVQKLSKYQVSRLPDFNEAEFVVDLQEQPELDFPIPGENEEESGLRTTRARTEPYIYLPLLPLTEMDKRWLRVVYDHFVNSVEDKSYDHFTELHRDFDGDFSPVRISGLLLVGGSHITLYGIYHLDQLDPLIELFDLVVLFIKGMFSVDGNDRTIKATAVAEAVGCSIKQVGQVFRLLQWMPGFQSGMGWNLESEEYTLKLAGVDISEAYRKYKGLQAYMDTYLASNLEIQSAKKTQPDGKGVEENDNEPLNLGRTRMNMKSREGFEPVMGVRNLAQDMAGIIGSMKSDKGQMIGIFGRWGRGKTFFLKELSKVLKGKAAGIESAQVGPKQKYKLVEYHAWKYQETPASWAYLYESMADAYLGSKKGLLWFCYCWRLLILNYHRFGLWLILRLILGILVAIAIPYVTHLWLGDSYEEWGIVIGGYLVSGLALHKISEKYAPKAAELIKKYAVRHSFKESMGIQADIQHEIIKLLEVWIPEKSLEKERVILIVEDIDRCSEWKIMENIDALRVMLEEKVITERLLIITAIDERVLRNAIRLKYDSLTRCDQGYDLKALTTEYMDKLFICAIKLGGLTGSQKNEFLDQVLKGDKEETDDPGSVPRDTEPKDPAHFSANNPGRDNLDLGGMASSTPATSGSGSATLLNQAIPSPAWAKLNATEESVIRQRALDWPDCTPRKLLIFYYRYLLCKNLLMNRYDHSRRTNPWATRESIKAILEALVYFGTCHEPEKICEAIAKIKEPENKSTEIPGLKDFGQKDPIDIAELLEVMEVVVAY